jgi:beta-glucosidase
MPPVHAASAALSLLALLAACGDDLRAPDAGGGPSFTGTIKVMTINLRHDVDQWERRAPLVADEIARLQPDLIGMQEVEIKVDQSGQLLDLIAARGGPAYEVYEHLKWFPYGEFWGEGIAIFSRYPILASYTANLLDGGRVALWTRVELRPGYELDLFDTHLEAGGEEADIRTAQAGLTVDFMHETAPEHIQILTGDMNAKDDSDAYAVYTGDGLVDSYRAVHGDESDTIGNTVTIVLADGAFDQHPTRRIDYVFASPREVAGARVDPVDSVLCFQNHDDGGFYPSDHLGVMTTYDVVIPYQVSPPFTTPDGGG